ncbi:MAG: Smr/MutS family protein [Paludibacteraceae bacterium]|nr:Smr/MutS family protein [Paludibacteraceae bacterium]
MPLHTLTEQKIGFDEIRRQTAALCLGTLGQACTAQIGFMTDAARISHSLDSIAQMADLLSDSSINFPQEAYHDLTEPFSRIRTEGRRMDLAELNALLHTLRLTDRMLHLLRQADPARFGLLTRLTENISPVRPLIDTLDSAIDPYGEIRDSADDDLRHTRQQIRATQAAIARTMQHIMQQARTEGLIEQDVSPTLRDGRTVIPIAPQHRRRLPGILHDASATGKTVYIEPAEVVEQGNRLRQLHSTEQHLIERILMRLTDSVRACLPNLQATQQLLGTLDMLRAQALMARQMNAIRPRLTDQPHISWQQAVHPLLQQNLNRQGRSAVPLDISLNSQQRILLISGPNAGGKSVCLKTVALLQYMLQCGMHVPMSHTSVTGLFDDIMIDIGDEQSIENELSTYSSHLRNMKHFLRHATPRTLLLIDELGSGTEPQIGAAIAQAILQQLNTQQTYAVVTTHYNALKHFAQDADGIQNAAMLYDRSRLQPLFKLQTGRPGSSFALEIAHNIGLPRNIIDEATRLVGTDYVDYDRHLQDIARDKRYWQQKRQQIHQQEKQLEEQIRQYREQMQNIRDTRRQTIAQAQQDAQQLLQQTHALIENTIRRIKESNADKQATQHARQKLQNREQNLQRAIDNDRRRQERQHTHTAATSDNTPADALTPGGYALIRSRNISGRIMQLNATKATIAIGQLKTTVDISDLQPITAAAYRRQHPETQHNRTTGQLSEQLRERKLHFSHDIDVRGMRADEALQAVRYFIDDAIMVQAGTVRILHGTGNGILRQLIRQQLNTIPAIHFHDEHIQHGGAGITVVEIE